MELTLSLMKSRIEHGRNRAVWSPVSRNRLCQLKDRFEPNENVDFSWFYEEDCTMTILDIVTIESKGHKLESPAELIIEEEFNSVWLRALAQDLRDPMPYFYSQAFPQFFSIEVTQSFIRILKTFSVI